MFFFCNQKKNEKEFRHTLIKAHANGKFYELATLKHIKLLSRLPVLLTTR